MTNHVTKEPFSLGASDHVTGESLSLGASDRVTRESLSLGASDDVTSFYMSPLPKHSPFRVMSKNVHPLFSHQLNKLADSKFDSSIGPLNSNDQA